VQDFSEINRTYSISKVRKGDIMVSELIKNGYGDDEDFNCAEKILYASNKAYNLGLDKNSLKMAAGFGGGMGIEDKCGALTASIMVLGRLFIKEKAHESDRVKILIQELFDKYKDSMGSIDCAPLKDKHRTEELKCKNVILGAAEILDEIVSREVNLNI
jgi:C_GCAxxG_C_C family probable redox protein